MRSDQCHVIQIMVEKVKISISRCHHLSNNNKMHYVHQHKPWMLTQEKCDDWMGMSGELINAVDSNVNFLWKIVTGNKNWVFPIQFLKKIIILMWKSPSLPDATVNKERYNGVLVYLREAVCLMCLEMWVAPSWQCPGICITACAASTHQASSPTVFYWFCTMKFYLFLQMKGCCRTVTWRAQKML